MAQAIDPNEFKDADDPKKAGGRGNKIYVLPGDYADVEITKIEYNPQTRKGLKAFYFTLTVLESNCPARPKHTVMNKTIVNRWPSGEENQGFWTEVKEILAPALGADNLGQVDSTVINGVVAGTIKIPNRLSIVAVETTNEKTGKKFTNCTYAKARPGTSPPYIAPSVAAPQSSAA